MRPRIRRITIAGFRGFGTLQQIAEPADTVSVFWGGNSHGKTSFSEAIEFLLTGQIARRELLAGAKDEFADSLRNAHIDDKAVVAVEASLLDAAGQGHTVRRELVEDYKRGSAAECVSKLTIDGNQATQADLVSQLGLTLFPPPLQAPVLSQHSLGFLFSSSPADRATYFRAVLDTQDLEDFRQAVAALEGQLERPIGPELDDIAALQKAPAFADFVKSLVKCKDKKAVEKALSGEIERVLKDAGLTPGADLPACAAQLNAELGRRRDRVFPVNYFSRQPYSSLSDESAPARAAIQRYVHEKAACDAEALRLVGLFEAALKIDDLNAATEDQDCPLCGAEQSLSPGRIAWITEQVRATANYQSARKALVDFLARLATLVERTKSSVSTAMPRLAAQSRSDRIKAGFTRANLRTLGIDDALVTDWLRDYLTIRRAGRKLIASLDRAIAALPGTDTDVADWAAADALVAALDAIGGRQTDLVSAIASYEGPSRRLGEAVKAVIDEASAIAGWEALAKLGADPEGALAAIGKLATFAQQEKAVAKALADIDKAIGSVQDAKFAELSGAVRKWWDLLRPDEMTFFDAVQRRSARARRMIDLRAGLALKDDRSDAKFRDAVAVFSQSQLHCLGLAIFLARASTEKVGFIVLDDPVLTSDEDYRPNFASGVIEGLLAEGIQVIIATQDYSTAKDIGTRWSFRGSARFNIVRNDPLLGSEIRNEDDDLAALIAKAVPFCNTDDPELRKQGGAKVRECIERFGKLLLVKDRQGKGETLASITDYDGQNFGNYSAKVMALLTKDPSHPGKLQAAHNYATPGPHDDAPPPKAQLKVAIGDLKRLKADYLG